MTNEDVVVNSLRFEIKEDGIEISTIGVDNKITHSLKHSNNPKDKIKL